MTDPKTLYRRDDPETSRLAAESLNLTRLEQLVLDAVRRAGPDGVIQDDVLRQFPALPYSSVTARFKALRDRGAIVYAGDTRPGRTGRRQRVARVPDPF